MGWTTPASLSPVYREHQPGAEAPPRAIARPGLRRRRRGLTPTPVQTNIRQGGGNNGPG